MAKYEQLLPIDRFQQWHICTIRSNISTLVALAGKSGVKQEETEFELPQVKKALKAFF